MHKRKVTGFTEAALEALIFYSWPGNIRELENLIERGVILAPDDGGIDISHLFTSGENIRREPARAEPTTSPPEMLAVNEESGQKLSALLREAFASGQLSLDGLEENAVNQALHLAQGNVSGAAKILGTTRARVAYRLSGRKVRHPAEGLE
jgi:DNA-binding NtrC family response regulator